MVIFFPDSTSEEELQELKKGAKKAQASAFAPGTFNNLTYQWVRYIQFCTNYNLQALPTSQDVLVWYAQYTANTVKAHATVISYLSGIKTLHLLLGLSTEPFRSFLLKLTLRGLRRLNTHKPKQAAPMTPLLLTKMYSKLDMTKEKDRIFWAVSLLSFFLLFRKSNLVPAKKSGFQEQKQITWGDFESKGGRVLCNIRWTKTNQYRDELLSFPLPHLPWSVLCPVRALRNVRTAARKDSDHCFALLEGGSYTYSMFNAKLKKVVKMCGEDETTYSSHSYRHGGSTWCFLSGVPTELIHVLGNWSSDCYLRYIHYPLEARTAASDLIRLRLRAAGL